MELLLHAPWEVTISAANGYPTAEERRVRIPNVAAFLAQKILIHNKRERADKAKDSLYIHDTFEASEETCQQLAKPGKHASSPFFTPSLASLGSQIYNPEPNYFNLNLSGGFKLAGISICAPLTLDTNQIQAADDVSYSHGKPFIQFGFDGIYKPFNRKGFNNENGLFTTYGSYSGFAQADFLLGAVSSFNKFNAAAAVQHYEQKYIAFLSFYLSICRFLL